MIRHLVVVFGFLALRRCLVRKILLLAPSLVINFTIHLSPSISGALFLL